MPAQGPSCGTCAHWARADKTRGECRANPPLASIVGMNPQSGPITFAFWPSTGMAAWCSSWKPRVQAQAGGDA